MSQINSIFVYGTLQPGKQNGKILKKIKGTWKKGFVFGKLINISKGINYGYPVIEIKIPTLSERKSDIKNLCEHFIENISGEQGISKKEYKFVSS